jgi:uncharacterized protein YneF (UPF0154 family)
MESLSLYIITGLAILLMITIGGIFLAISKNIKKKPPSKTTP